MESLDESINCPICGNIAWLWLYVASGYKKFICDGCGWVKGKEE